MVAPAVTVRTVFSGASASEDSSYAFQAVSELCSAGYVEISAATRRAHRMRVVQLILVRWWDPALGPVTRPITTRTMVAIVVAVRLTQTAL